MSLTETEISRYARQLLLPGMGVHAQERLRGSCVKAVGAGAVGGPALLYLAEAGVGTLLIDDAGSVGPSDAWLHGPRDAGRPRTDAVPEVLRAANRFVEVRGLQPADRPNCVLVSSESDDLRTASAEAARRAGLPCVVVEANGAQGAVVVLPEGGPCYGCGRRSASGVCTSPADAAALGALAALEVVLLVAGAGQSPRARRIDLVNGSTIATPIMARPECRCAAKGAGPMG